MIPSGTPPATILTSAVGLGIYIPALLNRERLRAAGQAAEVEVLEAFYTPDKLRAHLAARQAHRDSFALAQIANRMARDVADCIDAPRLAALLATWAAQSRSRFIVWSGFWLPVLERYRAQVHGRALDVHHCRIDADISASFRIFPQWRDAGREIWLWRREPARVVHEIPVTAQEPTAWDARGDRLVVHGGGWGIGTYMERLGELAKLPFALDIVVHDPAEAAGHRAGDRCWRLDPQWEPWRRDERDEFTFPPMGLVHEVGAASPFENRPDRHVFHDVIRGARAVVSKPGGCTLIDSLAAATPVVFLEAYGSAEQHNAEVWQKLGYGISMAGWRASGYSGDVLAQLHRNLLSRRPAPAYPDTAP